MKPFSELVLTSRHRLAMPILSYPGGSLAGVTVNEMVHAAQHQAAAQFALRDRFHLPILMSAMDLSVEAEAFGAPVEFSEHEVPTVSERLVTDEKSIDALKVPRVGTQRSGVFLEAVRLLASRAEESLVLGCMIGPFSLAGRLFGTGEILLAAAEKKAAVSLLVAKSAAFLFEYARAFSEAGAHGVIIAEPTAGLISPKAAEELSSRYIRNLAIALEDDSFQVVLHNCGARPIHLATIATPTK